MSVVCYSQPKSSLQPSTAFATACRHSSDSIRDRSQCRQPVAHKSLPHPFLLKPLQCLQRRAVALGRAHHQVHALQPPTP